ncbi:hypothetical protein ScPMuIL_008499 [Solemya velum]
MVNDNVRSPNLDREWVCSNFVVAFLEQLLIGSATTTLGLTLAEITVPSQSITSRPTVITTLGRYELYDTFGYKYYSLNKIKDVVDQLKEDADITIDMTGMEQITDAVFSVLLVHKVSRFSSVRNIILDGCLHITDQGLCWVSECFDNLEKVSVKGLVNVTETGLHHLLTNCPQLSTIDLTGTDVCILPKMVAQKEVVLAGCPLVSPDRETLKKVVLASAEPKFSKPADKDVVKMCIIKTEDMKQSLLRMIVGGDKISHSSLNAVHEGYKLSADLTANIFECQESVLDLFLTKRTVYIFPYELSNNDGVQAVARKIFGLISYILSKVQRAAFLLVSVTEGKTTPVPPEALEKAIIDMKQKTAQELENQKNSFLNPTSVLLNPFELSLVDFDKQREYTRTWQFVHSLQNLKLQRANFNITRQLQEGDILQLALVESSKAVIGQYPEYADLSLPVFNYAVTDKVKEMLKDGVMSMENTKSSTHRMMEVLQTLGKTICYQFAGEVPVVFRTDWLVGLLNVVMAPPTDGGTNRGLISCVSDTTPLWKTEVLEKALAKVVPNDQVKFSLQILSRLGLGHYYKVFTAFSSLEPAPPVPVEHYFPIEKDNKMLTASYSFRFPFIVPPSLMHRIMYLASQIRRPIIAWNKGMVIQESIVELLMEEKTSEEKSNLVLTAQVSAMKMEQPRPTPSKKKKKSAPSAATFAADLAKMTVRLVEMMCHCLEQYKLVVDYAVQEHNLSAEIEFVSDHPKPIEVSALVCRHKMESPNPDNSTQLACSNCGITPRISKLLWFMYRKTVPTSSFIDKSLFAEKDLNFQKGNIVKIMNIFRPLRWRVDSMMTVNEHNICNFTLMSGSPQTLKLGMEEIDQEEESEQPTKKNSESKGMKKKAQPIPEPDNCLWKIPINSFQISLGETISFELLPAGPQFELVISQGREQIAKVKVPKSLYRPCCSYHFDARDDSGTASAEVMFHGLITQTSQKVPYIMPGMKLEALDRLNPHLVCVATVEDVTDDGKLLIHFDGWTSKYDYLADPTSVDLHPIGYMNHVGHTYRKYNSDLQEPKGYGNRQGHKAFQWATYLKETTALPVPFEFFTKEQREGTPADLELTVLKKLGIEDDTKMSTCFMVRNRPRVLEQEVINSIELSSILVDFFASHDKFVCLLPYTFNSNSIVYPNLRSITNLERQKYHLLCPGLKMELLHFLNHTGLGLADVFGPDELTSVFQDLAPYLEICYLGLLVQENVLPFKIDNLCLGSGEIIAEKKEKLEISMKKTLFLYLSFLHFWNESQGKVLLANIDFASAAYMPLQRLIENALQKGLQSSMSGLDGSGPLRCVGHSASIAIGKGLSDVPVDKFQNFFKFIHKLDYSNNQIASLPEYFFLEFSHLEELYLSNNALTVLAPFTGTNSFLTHLDISNNQICALPGSFINIKNSLTYLNISHNPLNQMPQVVWACENLVELEADDIGEITNLENVKKLKQLTVLSLGQNVLKAVPDEIASLPLVELNLSGIPWMDSGSTVSGLMYNKFRNDWLQSRKNAPQSLIPSVTWIMYWNDLDVGVHPFMYFCLSSAGGIPPPVFQLTGLQKLNLSYQCLKSVPDNIKELSDLKSLDVSNNPDLETISSCLGSFALTELHLKACPVLKTPPKEIVDRGFASVFGYLKRLQLGSVSCKRTKLMLVGLGGAGKTSLVRCLTKSVYRGDLGHDEVITDGIDIENWEVDVGDNKEPLVYSVWDFAGQTVYYNTHQFFLSNRAVYLLLWNVRLGYDHAGLDFWLNSIACHAPKSPILVVGTHVDKVAKSKIPTEELQRCYPQIAAFHYVSSYSGTGIDALKGSLLHITLQEKYMGERIPEAWLTLEKTILSYHDNVHDKNRELMPWKQLEKIANACGIFENTELIQAVQFLHDLGSVQFFNTDFLRSYVVISPQWIVDVMKCIVTVHVGPVQEGKLLHKDMSAVWKDYPEYIRPWLLRLTEEFDLTFPLPDEKANLVPCLLPTEEPKIDWPAINPDSGIRESKMIYIFQYLPAGLFNRAQVRLHQFSKGAIMWKKGSFLKKNDSHIALLLQTGSSKVLVKCQGIQPENFLFSVHQVFRILIAESYGGVQYDFLISCMECLEANETDPSMIPATKIQRAVEHRAPFLQCENFHNLALPDLKAHMPPTELSDFDDHLRRNFDDLHGLKGTVSVFFCFTKKNIPGLEKEGKLVHPGNIMEDLRAHGLQVSFSDTPETENIESLTVSFKNAQVVLFGMSDEFCMNEKCYDLITYARDTLRKPILLVLLGETKKWQEGDQELPFKDEVFVNMQDKSRYKTKLDELVAVIDRKVDSKKKDYPKCFVSYCWKNSQDAIDKGSKAEPGSVGWEDPRKIKEFLESKNIPCWIDVERVGVVGLYNDIAEGLRKARVMVCCVSTEYAKSTNCRMEFLFALTKLRIPVVLAVVGTGYDWEGTELGMVSIGHKCPKVNFQLHNESGYLELLNLVQTRLPDAEKDENTSQKFQERRRIAYQETLEMVERNFLWHVAEFADSMDTTSYPRLFVVDLTDSGKPGGKRPLIRRMSSSIMVANLIQRSGQEAGPKEDSEEKKDLEDKKDSKEKKDSEEKEVMKEKMASNLPRSQYCFRLLCEHEQGWHDVSPSIPFPDMAPHDEEEFINKVAPFAARILAVLKKTNLQLACLTTPEGHRLQRTLDEACLENMSDFGEEYKLLRQCVIAQDSKQTMAGLNRCHTASGKMLWLCDKHKSTVISRTEDRYREELGLRKKDTEVEKMAKIIPAESESARLPKIKEENVLKEKTSVASPPKPTVFSSTNRPRLQRQTSQACSVM